MERWLSVKEAAAEFRITHKRLLSLIRAGHIGAINIGTPEQPSFRILDPAPEIKRHLIAIPQMEEFPVISSRELAELIGVSQEQIRWLVHQKMLVPTGKSRSLFFTAKEVRRYLARRERTAGQRKFTYSRILVDWMRDYIRELKPNGEIMNALINEAVDLPEPERSARITELWNHFDRVNAILKYCLIKSKERQPQAPSPEQADCAR